MKLSFKQRILVILIPIIIILVSTSAVILADQVAVKQEPEAAFTVLRDEPVTNMETIRLNSDADAAAAKTPVAVVAPNLEGPQISDIRRTFIFGFVILILLTVSLIFVFSFSR